MSKPIDHIPEELWCLHCKVQQRIAGGIYLIDDGYYCALHNGTHADEPCTMKDMVECGLVNEPGQLMAYRLVEDGG